jgi:hypothetical protein
MTRETKVGLMMVALLVGVFGFLLYKRVHRPAEVLADQETTAGIRRAENEALIPQRSESDPAAFAFGVDEPPRNVRLMTTRDARSDDFSTESATSDAFKEEKSKRRKVKPAAVAVVDDVDFDQFADRPVAPQPKRREADFEPVENAFDDGPERRKPNRVIEQVAAVSESDPFASDGPEDKPGHDSRSPDLDRRERSRSMPGDPDQENTVRESRFAPPATVLEAPVDEPRRLESPGTHGYDRFAGERTSDSRSNRNDRQLLTQTAVDVPDNLEPAPREARRSAPISMEEREFSPEATPRAQSSTHGQNYVIEPNDNFWIISRKRYGAGRFYMALAQHNQQIIPDAKRMKPGITISTPDVSVLEHKYAQLIPKAAAPDSVAPATATQSRKLEDSGPSGYFVGADGSPMYRVGGQDTLTDIAKSHLGRSSRWVQILEINRNVLRSGNDLRIGTVLRLPSDASRVQVVGTSREFR